MDKYFRIMNTEELSKLRPYELRLNNDDFPERGHYHFYVGELSETGYIKQTDKETYKLLIFSDKPRDIMFEGGFDIDDLRKNGVICEVPEKAYINEVELRERKSHLEIKIDALEYMELDHWRDKMQEGVGTPLEQTAKKEIQRTESQIEDMKKEASVIDRDLKGFENSMKKDADKNKELRKSKKSRKSKCI